MVHGPTARMCRLSVSSWGADVSVKGWYSLVPRARQAIRTHCPDLYSKPWGRWNSRWVTPEEGRWAVAHCSESGNSGAPQEFPHLRPQLCFWNMTKEASPHQKSQIPPQASSTLSRVWAALGLVGSRKRSSLAQAPPLSSVRVAQIPWQRASYTHSLIPTTSRPLLTPLGQALPCPVSIRRTTSLLPRQPLGWYLKAAALPSPR